MTALPSIFVNVTVSGAKGERVHASTTYGVLAMDAYAFHREADAPVAGATGTV